MASCVGDFLYVQNLNCNMSFILACSAKTQTCIRPQDLSTELASLESSSGFVLVGGKNSCLNFIFIFIGASFCVILQLNTKILQAAILSENN